MEAPMGGLELAIFHEKNGTGILDEVSREEIRVFAGRQDTLARMVYRG